jgi:hypothetical protein
VIENRTSRENAMARNVRTDSRLASAFATLVCTWAVVLVVLGLTTAPSSGKDHDTPPVAAAMARR